MLSGGLGDRRRKAHYCAWEVGGDVGLARNTPAEENFNCRGANSRYLPFRRSVEDVLGYKTLEIVIELRQLNSS
jgi:hypothetical protein